MPDDSEFLNGCGEITTNMLNNSSKTERLRKTLMTFCLAFRAKQGRVETRKKKRVQSRTTDVERNAEMKKLYEAGLSKREIAKKFNITLSRVHQIVGKTTKPPKAPKPPKPPKPVKITPPFAEIRRLYVLGFTQVQLSQRFKISQTYVSHIVNGRR